VFPTDDKVLAAFSKLCESSFRETLSYQEVGCGGYRVRVVHYSCPVADWTESLFVGRLGDLYVLLST
jgi:hypothetical protein